MAYTLNKKLLGFLTKSAQEKEQGTATVVSVTNKVLGVKQTTLQLSGGVSIDIPAKELSEKVLKVDDVVTFNTKTGEFICFERPKKTVTEKIKSAVTKTQRGEGTTRIRSQVA